MISMIRITFMEVYKKRILIIVLLMSSVFLALYGTALHFAIPQTDQSSAILRFGLRAQLLNMGLYASSLIIACLSIFSSTGLVAGEMENGTIDGLISKPISRMKIIMGKYIGVLTMLCLYSTMLFGAVLGLNAYFGGGLPGISPSSLLSSLGIYLMLPALLAALGIHLSTFLPTMGGSITLVILYFIGTIGGMVEAISGLMNGNAQRVMQQIGIVTSLIIPTDVIYRKAKSAIQANDLLSGMTLEGLGGASTAPSNIMMVYIGAYIILFVYLAGSNFAKRDF